MMEIEFRGQRADNKEWVYGDLLNLHNGDKYIVNNKFGACIDDKGNFINTESPFVCKVIPETVGRYTGIADKNGKKIFEHDIVDCWSEGKNARGTVQQRKDGLWIIYPSWQKNIMWGLCPDINGGTTVEVIGTVFDKESDNGNYKA